MTDRAAQIQALAARVRACQACRLHQGTTNAVPGAGNPEAEILFVGEAPGFHEDQRGLPFVGRSGQYLEKLLAILGLKRTDVYIANVVNHRPPDNRDPLPDELQACRAFIDEHEAILDPLVIVTLGRFSMGRYFPNGKISQIHGQPRFDERRAYLPLYHPAAVLRSPNLDAAMQADFKRIPDLLAEVKQRRAALAKPPAPPKPEPPKQLSLF